MHAIGQRIEKHLCTTKQAATLSKFKVEFDPNKTTFAQASSMIDQIAKNSWRKPASFTMPAQETKSQPPPRVYAEKGVDDDDIPF